jgi:hypothetical protein
MTEASASATLVDTHRPLIKDQTINSRKLVGPYRTKAEMKTDTERKTGNNSDVSLISDFDPDGSPVKEILRSVPGAMSMPDLSEVAKVPTRDVKAPMKPISPRTAVVRQEADQSGASSAVETSASEDDADQRIISAFSRATSVRTPWCNKKMVRLAVARPHVKIDELWKKVVGDQTPNEPFATAFFHAAAAARWAHQKALDAINAKVAKLY